MTTEKVGESAMLSFSMSHRQQRPREIFPDLALLVTPSRVSALEGGRWQGSVSASGLPACSEVLGVVGSSRLGRVVD
jgi:hypothetical protein